jgi:mRNA interferase MazF
MADSVPVAGPPARWHIYVVDLDPRIGTKPGNQRPCIAVQPTAFGVAGLTSTVIVPLTTNLVVGDAFPLRVRIPAGVCGLTHASDALIDQVVAWDNRRFRRDLGEVPETLRRTLRRGLAEFLDVC